MLLGNLSPEVWKRIIDFVVAFEEHKYFISASPGKKTLSRMSRVCRELATTLRPLLFSILQLKSSSDISVLRSILQSTVSGWLGTHVSSISFYDCDNSFLPSATLLSYLPSVREIHYRHDSLDQVFKVPLVMRPHLSRLQSLCILELGQIVFPSFSALLQIVGSISSLEKLTLKDVEWRLVCEPDQLPDCKAGFSNLKEVECSGLNSSPSWPVAWIFGAAATGYTYRRHGVIARNPDAGVPPLDISVIVSFVKMVVLSSRWHRTPKFLLTECSDKGTVIFTAVFFSFCNANDINNLNGRIL
jgi:hypothetical protein